MWQGRRVLITGHTGFKGGWLAMWLAKQAAEVHGVALPPPTAPSLCVACRVEECLASSHDADIREPGVLERVIAATQPEVIFHLAAQPLVRESYRCPLATLETNVMGTARLLEAVRHARSVRAVVVVTTDKCYDNREWDRAYREADPLGGHDPYSMSKAAAELVAAAWRQSFLAEAGVAVATARAGNVIGGGDFAPDRLVPDCLRAIDAGETLLVRSPAAVRPWQHVLEPLSGYLLLAERLLLEGDTFAEAWNFGPADVDGETVASMVERICRGSDARWTVASDPQPHEANALRLESGKARHRLGWRNRWTLPEAIDATLAWHRAWRAGVDMRSFTLSQIAAFEQAGGEESARPDTTASRYEEAA
jgi:CDP-glucose 4,6-dehydratase